MKRDTIITTVGVTHAAFFLIGGLWPLVDMQSFESVTGPRSDHWLVRSLAGMLIIVGAALIWSVQRGHIDHSMRGVAAGSSGMLALVALISGMNGPVDPVSVIGASLHGVLALCWVAIMLTAGSAYRPRPIIEAKRMRQKQEEDPGRWK